MGSTMRDGSDGMQYTRCVAMIKSAAARRPAWSWRSLARL